MAQHLGRLIDHLNLVVADLEASRAFYLASAGALGTGVAVEDGPDSFSMDELYVSQKGGAYGAAPVTRLHLAFQARDEAAVRAWHAAVLAAGGRDNGAPGPRPYHPGYFAAFALDPDGNNVEAVCHGPVARSAPSVTVSPESVTPETPEGA